MALRYFLIFLIGVMSFSGCAKIAHLQELLTMKAYGDNEAMKEKYIEEADKKFESLLAAVKNNEMAEYPNAKSILKKFGEPIFIKAVTQDNQVREQWLYRHAMRFTGSPKVYLYFDEAGTLVNSRYVEPENSAGAS